MSADWTPPTEAVEAFQSGMRRSWLDLEDGASETDRFAYAMAAAYPAIVAEKDAEIEQLRAACQPMSEARLRVEDVLDRALGEEEVDGAGEGLASDVQLVVDQRDEARAEVERWKTTAAGLAAEVGDVRHWWDEDREKLAAVTALAEDESRHMVRWIDRSHLIDLEDLQAALNRSNTAKRTDQ